MSKLALASDAIPLVATTAERGSRFPTPDLNQRVQNLETGVVERFDSTYGWVVSGAHCPMVNVMAFGATGDGTTDDTAAFSAAVASASIGDILVVPAGYNFRINRVTIDRALTIRVDGLVTLIGYQYGATPPTAFIVTADDVAFCGTGKLSGPGQFDHATVGNVQYIPSLIRLTSVDRTTISGLTFENVPQAGIAIYQSPFTRISGCRFVGGDTVASCVADINYYAIHGYQSDYCVIVDNQFLDDADGNTFAEGVFFYGTNYGTFSRNFAKNIVDHDFYLYHSVGDLTGVNNHNTLSGNVSYSTLTNLTQKVGSSIKVHGEHNTIAQNDILNANSGILLECGSHSTITNNMVSGFMEQGIIVTDLVAANASGLSYITVSGNTLYGADDDTTGIYYRGDGTYTTANCVGGKILGNTVVRCGDDSGASPSPIDVYHSNSSYYMDAFVVADNVIINPRSVFGMFFDRVRYSRIAGNTVKDGTYTGWRGLRLDTLCTFNAVVGNTVRDDQGSPKLSIGCNFGAASDTDNILSGNVFHSLYASRSDNPWGVDASLRNIGDRNTHSDVLGYPVALSTAEASVNITASPSIVVPVAVPSGARLVGVQLRVDSALAGGDLWDAAYSGGSTTAIATSQAVAKNTKVNLLYNANGATDITSNTTNVTISKNGGGSFTSQGKIRALVYYESLTALGNAP